MTMISKKMQEALNMQVNDELWSAYLYLSMSMDAEAKGLRGVAHWMYVQWQEELGHARRLQCYMIGQNARVELMPITEVPTSWNTPLSMFKDSLVHEKEITKAFNNLTTLAIDEGDYATYNCLQWFVDEQVEEEATVRDIIDQLDMAGGDNLGLYFIDHQLSERKNPNC